jgi:uncharacterized protein YPO0396
MSEELPEKIINPYKILSKFVLWEIMDLESMIEAVQTKYEIFKIQKSLVKAFSQHQKELQLIRSGKVSRNMLRTKTGKIKKITLLNEQIENEVKEISCSECLNTIVYL